AVQGGTRVVFQDRNGGVWVGTRDRGLFHVDREHIADSFGRAEGLSADFIDGVYEDREGSVWVSTLEGIDRFRPLAAVTYSVRQGISGGARCLCLPAKMEASWSAQLKDCIAGAMGASPSIARGAAQPRHLLGRRRNHRRSARF